MLTKFTRGYDFLPFFLQKSPVDQFYAINPFL